MRRRAPAGAQLIFAINGRGCAREEEGKEEEEEIPVAT